jgi:histidinol-phosphate aminotransferase
MPLSPRSCILSINPYVQGLAELNTTGKVIKLSSNEAALGASPNAIAAYSNLSSSLQRYCDGTAAKLRSAIGEVNGLDPERIVCGAGSDELIALLIQAYVGEGDEVLYSQYGFLMYPISTLKVGGVPVKAPEKSMQTDVDAMLAAVTARTKIVFVANPNNPTGSYISINEIKRLRAGLRSNILLVLDSAYAEFVDKADFSDGREIVDLPGENTVMLRTFSKIYGLAGLRIGWAYAPPSIADILNRVRGPFNISAPSIDAGIAAIKDVAFTEKARLYNDQCLAYMLESFTAIGLKPFPSVTNFVMVEFPSGDKNAAHADAFLKENGIITRALGSYELGHCLRFTLGLEEDNKVVIDVLRRFMQS